MKTNKWPLVSPISCCSFHLLLLDFCILFILDFVSFWFFTIADFVVVVAGVFVFVLSFCSFI